MGLGGAALACVWERAAYVGLADFSTDYRTTALFWEMHVGGAALDGFLALTLPFAVHQLLIARHPLRWALAAALCVLGAYAALSTFSRILYIALPLGLATLAVLHALQQRNRSMKISGEVSDTLTDEPEGPAWPAALVLIGGFAAMAASIFPGSGYRGMLALLGNLLLLLLLGPRLRRLGTVQWVTAAVLSLVGAMAVLALHWFTDKGAYIAHGLTLFIAATLALLRPRAARGALLTLAVAGYAPLLLASALVTRHWGGDEALRGALPALLLLAVALPAVACVRRHRPWPRSLRWQASVLSAMAVSAVAVGVFGGGAYMGERFAGGNADQSGRVAQWRQSIEWLRTPNQWLLGIGLGRFPDHYAQTAAADQRPSDHRLRREPDRSTLLLSAGPWSAAGSGTLHLSQRIARPRGVLTVKLRVRSALEAALHIDLCQKHLIYSTGCISGVMAVAALPGEWQRLSLTLDAGEKLQMADWFASPSVVFSLSTESFQAPLEIAEIAMTDGLGRPLLANGQWRQDLTRWFLTSERFHKPWHAHNLAVHLLVEQGVLGLGLWAGLSLAALWRLSVGRARAHPLAPALAAALVGFWVVGGIDSLLDLPRIATLFMLLLLLAFKLPTVGPMWAAAAGSPR